MLIQGWAMGAQVDSNIRRMTFCYKMFIIYYVISRIKTLDNLADAGPHG